MNKLMKMVLVVVLVALPQFMIGQTENNTGNSGEIFETVGNPPQFPKLNLRLRSIGSNKHRMVLKTKHTRKKLQPAAQKV